MQTKFNEIVNNGQSVVVEISFAEGSQFTMDSEMGSFGLPLSDQIEAWMAKNALKNNYHIQGTTKLKMVFDEVSIPIKDKTGKKYTSNNFALEVFKYLKSLALEPSKDIKGNTIYITIK